MKHPSLSLLAVALFLLLHFHAQVATSKNVRTLRLLVEKQAEEGEGEVAEVGEEEDGRSGIFGFIGDIVCRTPLNLILGCGEGSESNNSTSNDENDEEGEQEEQEEEKKDGGGGFIGGVVGGVGGFIGGVGHAVSDFATFQLCQNRLGSITNRCSDGSYNISELEGLAVLESQTMTIEWMQQICPITTFRQVFSSEDDYMYGQLYAMVELYYSTRRDSRLADNNVLTGEKWLRDYQGRSSENAGDDNNNSTMDNPDEERERIEKSCNPCKWNGVRCIKKRVVEISLPRSSLRHSLYGTLPSSLGMLTTLTAFNIRGNQIGGSIPGNFGELLFHLDVSNNQLSGSIPANLGGEALLRMDLSFNSLSGNIPEELANGLKWIKKIDLSNNAIGPTFPNGLVGIESLAELYLHNNHIIGSVDEAYCDRLAYNISDLLITSDCGGSNPLVNCDCCTCY